MQPQPTNTQCTADRLKQALGENYLILLARLLEDVSHETGYGNVTLFIRQGKVLDIQATKSYRPATET